MANIILFNAESENQIGASQEYSFESGDAQIVAFGTFDGATVSVQFSPDNGDNWLSKKDINSSAISLTSPDSVLIKESSLNLLRGVISGVGAETDITLIVQELGGGTGVIVGGGGGGNSAPMIASSLVDQDADEGVAFSYQFAVDAFTDADMDALSYTAALAGGGALPAWLTFTPATRTFSGTPASGDVGTIAVRVTASDGVDSGFDDFDIVVAAAVASGVPTHSIVFDDSLEQLLSMAMADFGPYDRSKFTIAFSTKRNTNGRFEVICAHSDGNTERAWDVYFDSTNKFRFRASTNGSSNPGLLQTTGTYSSTSDFYKFVLWYDGENTVANDRMKLWAGTTTLAEVTAFDSHDNPTGPVFDSSAPICVGAQSVNPDVYRMMDGHLHSWAFVSGANVAWTEFFDASTGEPKDLSGITGLKSWLSCAGGDPTKDAVLAADWNNVNGVTTSTTIPT